MTLPTALPRRVRIGPRRRAELLIAVLAAKLLARQPPRRIRAVLTTMQRNAAAATSAEVDAVHRVVTATSARRAGRRGCLERSLTTVLLCRLRGMAVTWCVGVRLRTPTDAHAWVEIDGEPVGEPPGTRQAYVKVMTVPGGNSSR